MFERLNFELLRGLSRISNIPSNANDREYTFYIFQGYFVENDKKILNFDLKIRINSISIGNPYVSFILFFYEKMKEFL